MIDDKQIDKAYDVIIIGGGATGAGTARDCAMRGLKVLLLERFDYTSGATGRNHGLLHSGARYAVNDNESAAECIKENKILKKIASHCVENTSGLFITLPEDDLTYQGTFIERCKQAGINAYAIDPKEAIHMEPSVNPAVTGAVVVPDGSIDPFRLTIANVLDARAHGAVTLVYHEVVGFVREQNRIIGVKTYNHKTKEERHFYAEVIVNAGGIWGHHIAELAGVRVNMFPAKGALLIFGHRVNQVVLNRCRKPADADILVPGDMICVIGTTSSRVPYDEIDRMYVTAAEVELLLREGEKLAPSLATTRILRAYCGVRPLVAADNDPSGRNISRGIVLLDHASRDGLEGFITITGGKLMTYRLMAEKAADLACQKLGIDKKCDTAVVPLPGSEKTDSEIKAEMHDDIYSDLVASTSRVAEIGRHGTFTNEIPHETIEDRALVCECEEVSAGEVKFAVDKLHVHNLINLRRRTRIGMGTCQAELCACRASCVLCQVGNNKPEEELADLKSFMQERWKGMQPVAWGDTLKENQLTLKIYQELCGLNA